MPAVARKLAWATGGNDPRFVEAGKITGGSWNGVCRSVVKPLTPTEYKQCRGELPANRTFYDGTPQPYIRGITPKTRKPRKPKAAA